MKMLVLGHKGMLGQDLVLRLTGPHEVEGRDVDDFDIVSEADCRRVVAECNPEVVLNAAAYTNVDGCETDPERCMAVNGLGVKNIALACRGRGITLVHFSTDYVFDGRKRTPYDEADEPAPINRYGQSKLEGERFLQALADRYLLIRTAWLYGRHGRNFIHTILERSATVKSLEVVDDQVGSPTFSWDLALAVQRLVEGGHEGIFHITNRGRCSWYELAVKLLQYAGRDDVTVRPIASGQLARPAERPAWSVMSGQKFVAVTGKAMRFWQIALQDYLERIGHPKKG